MPINEFSETWSALTIECNASTIGFSASTSVFKLNMTGCNVNTRGFVASKTVRISVLPTAAVVGMIANSNGNNASSSVATQSARRGPGVAIIAASSLA